MVPEAVSEGQTWFLDLVTIVYGLMFATVLTTIILPVFYSIAFRIRNEAA